MRQPVTGVRSISDESRIRLSAVALVAAIGVAAFPLLEWLNADGVGVTGYDGRSQVPEDSVIASGPRLAYILLIAGAVVAVAAAMRLRPQGLAEPGPNLLLSHALFIAALVAFTLPLATLISAWQFDLVEGTGIGLWLGLVAGLVLLGVAYMESRERGAVAV